MFRRFLYLNEQVVDSYLGVVEEGLSDELTRRSSTKGGRGDEADRTLRALADVRPLYRSTMVESDPAAKGQFPFGRNNTTRPMRPAASGRARILVVGVYPSAFHVS